MHLDFKLIEKEIVGYDLEDAKVVNDQIISKGLTFGEFIAPYLDKAENVRDIHDILWGLYLGSFIESPSENHNGFYPSLEERRMIINSMKLIERNYDLGKD